VLYKLAVFPFHFWAPDVYEAAPHPVVAFIASVSKLAAIAVLCRLVTLLPPASERFTQILVLLSVVSMTLGNLAALVQRDLKRLLAWSTVAHAGYLLLGILAFTRLGLSAALFYGLVYMLLAYSCFLVVCLLGRDGANPGFDTLSGLHRRSPILALVLVVGVFGLAGIPPTPGFVGKWFLFSAALDQGYFWLVLVAAGNSTLALYYYLQVARRAYLEDPDDDILVAVSPAAVVVAVALLLAIIAFGVYPGPLWDLTQQAAASLFG
jgi:NADH-quinone oxidoreductase subunit N